MGAEVVWGPLPDGFEEEADTAASMGLSFGADGDSGDFQTLDRKRFAGPEDAWITVTALGPTDASASDWRIETEQSPSPDVEFIVGACDGCRLVVFARGVHRSDLLALLRGSSIAQQSGTYRSHPLSGALSRGTEEFARQVFELLRRDWIASGRDGEELSLDGDVLTFKLPLRTIRWRNPLVEHPLIDDPASHTTVDDALYVFFHANGVHDWIIEELEDHIWPRCPLSDRHPLFANTRPNGDQSEQWWTCDIHGISAPVGRLFELYARHSGS